MTEDRRPERLAIVLLLLTEAALCAGSFGQFFNHDSIFYIIHSPRDWNGALRLLLSPDDGRQYRPLTILFLAPFVRLWGPNPGLYHWIPLLFHLANTWLLYRLTRRLVRSTFVPVAAAWFWGLHSVTAWITYDITCISDFLSAFLLFSFLILAVDGVRSGSRGRIIAAFVLFALSLLTKETATTFPLALFLCLVANRFHDREGSIGCRDLRAAVRGALPLTALFVVTAVAFALRLISWFRSGAIYTQGTSAAYDVGPLANIAGKLRYLWWAFNFPDAGGALGRERLVTGLLIVVLIIWAGEVLLRRLRLSLLEVIGCVWFAGLCVPALMLSSRLAKWYLYVPLAGIALMFGKFADSLRDRVSNRVGGLAWTAPALLLGVPLLVSSVLQTRGYLRNSDAAYVSGRLQYWTSALQRTLGPVTQDLHVFFLPSFEVELQDMARLLSVPPVNEGRLLRLFYPGVTIQTRFAAPGDRLTNDTRNRNDLRVLQFLDGELHDVTRFARPTGVVRLFVLATSEGKPPPLMDKAPQGGWALYETFSHLEFGDRGAQLPDDYAHRPDIWILQYMHGHFYDVTDYWKGRRLAKAIRPFRELDRAQITVSRGEFYPDYDRFATPTGRAAFLPTPNHEIVTQIGGSSVVAPAVLIPAAAKLRFDLAWMNDSGDGGWAEMRIRSGSHETTIHREYMRPNPRGRGFHWKEIVVDLRQFAHAEVSLVLLCYNDVGRNTVSDWLNWRDIAIEEEK